MSSNCRLLDSLNRTSRQVLHLLRAHRRVSRSHLAQLTGLTRAAMSRAIQPLIESGLLGETGRAAAQGAGRPGELLQITGHQVAVLGLSVGTEIDLVLVDLGNQVLAHHSLPNRFPDSAPDDPAPAAVLCAAARELLTASGRELAGIGLAFSGDCPPQGNFIRLNYFASAGQGDRLREYLAAELGCPVVTENDTNAALLAERWVHPELPPYPSLLYVNDRLGAAVMLEGRLYQGPAEWPRWLGRQHIDRNLPVSDQTGSLAAYASLAGLTDQAAGYRYGTRPPRPLESNNRDLSALFERYAAGDPRTVESLRAGFSCLGRTVRNLALIFAFDRVALAGWTQDILAAGIRQIQAEFSADPSADWLKNLTLAPASLDRCQEAVGAALVAVERLLTAPEGRPSNYPG